MDDDLAARIEANVADCLLAMGTAGGGTQRVDESVSWTVGGSPIGYHNAVVRCDAPDAAAARRLVVTWREELRARRLPGSWHLTPAMRPPNLDDLLAAAGFEDGGEEPAMAADLTVDLPLAAPTGLDVRPVTGPRDLDAYRRVLGDGFGEGPEEADWVASVWAALGLGSAAWRHVIGSSDGEPVSTASLFLTGDVAGIYFVSTRPAARCRGFGTAITRSLMAAAVRSGATTAVLGSSPMGLPVYEALGFHTVFRYRLFELAGS